MAYAYYVPLVVQSGQVTGTLTDFPALISHTFAPWKSVANGGRIENTYFSLAADWAPFSDSSLTTQLDFEWIYWDATTGQVIAWVKVPSCATSTVIYIGYSDSAVTTRQDEFTHIDTWDNGFEAVYHFDLLSGLGRTDDASGNLHPLVTGTFSSASGFIYEVGSFNGSTQYGSHSAAVVTAAPLTVSAWIKPDVLTGLAMSSLVTAGAWNGMYLEVAGSGSITFATVSNDFAAFSGATQAGISTGTWFHIAGVTANASSRFAYVNGVAGSEATATVTPTVTPNNFTVGARRQGGAVGNYFDGLIDEVRVSSVARSAAWLEAEYHSQNDATAFWVLGSEQAVGGLRRFFLV